MERTTPPVGDVVRSRLTFAIVLGIGVLWGSGAALAQALTPEQDQKAKLLLQQGKESWEQKNFERVIRKYKQFIAEFPGQPEVTHARYHLALASVEMPTVDWNLVIDELQKVLAAKDAPKDKAAANYWLAVALRVTGEQQLEAAKTNPAQRAKAIERLAQAASVYAAVDASNPELAARAKVEAAEALIKCGKPAEAVERVKPLANSPAALLILGGAQFDAKDHAGAFQTLARLAPFDQPLIGIQARYLVGRILEETGQKPEAVLQYEVVARTYAQERVKAQQALQDANAWKGKVIERMRAESLVRAIPEFVVLAGFRAGMIQFGYGQYAEALPRLQQVVAVPQWEHKALAQLHLGICGVQTKQPQIAQNLEPLKEHPKLGDQAWWWFGRLQRSQADPANAAQSQNQFRAAVTSFAKAAEKAQQMAGGDPAAAARRGEMLVDQADTLVLLKSFKEAAAIYDAVAKDASNAERAEAAQEKLAMALHKAGDYAGSEQACAALLEKYPQSMLRPSVMFWQAENALKQGKKEEAVAKYQAVIDKYPEFAQAGLARFGLGMAIYAKGDYAKAAKVLGGISPPDRQGELLAASYYEADCLLRTLPQSGDDALSAARLAKQLEDAVGLLSNFVSSNEDRPEMPDATLKLADCYQRNAAIIADQQEKARLYQGARETYDKLIQKYPRHPAMAQAVMNRAEMLAAIGDVNSAINELNRFRSDANLLKSEAAPVALIKLSQVMVKNGRAVDASVMMEKGRTDFEKTLLADPKKVPLAAQMRYHHGVALREAGRGKEALALFDGIISQWPNTAEASEASLASIQVRQKESIDKLRATRQAVAAAPANKPVDAKLVEAKQEAMKAAAGVADAFAKHADKIAANAEGSDLHVRTLRDAAVTWRAIAEAEVEAARRARAEEALKKLQARAGSKTRPPGKSNSVPLAPEIKLSSIPAQPAEAKAREFFNKALEAAPDSRLANEIRLELAEMFIARGEADPAIQLISTAVDHNPPQLVLEQLRIRLGQCHLLKNDFDGALAQATICLNDTNSPIRPSAYLLRGRAYMAQRNWPEAMTVLSRYLNGAEKYRNAGPVTEEGLLALAEASRAAGAWEPARMAYENLIQRFPQSRHLADAWFGMGLALQQGKQFDRAVSAFTEATRKTNSETAAKAQLQIGLCRAEQKRWQEAVNELLIVPLTYDYADVAANSSLAAAKALVELKQKDQAKEVLKGVVEDHPATVWAAEAAKRLAEIQ